MPKGERVIAHGKSRDQDGAEWIYILRADESYGFVLGRRLHADRRAATQRQSTAVVNREQAAPEEQNRAGSGSRPETVDRHDQATHAPQTSGNYAGDVECVLPAGEIVKLSQQECRQRSGVVYR